MKSSKVSFDLKRFAGIKRDYSKEDVEKLKPSETERVFGGAGGVYGVGV